MDKTWFHHCLTGLLGPSALRKADLDAFSQVHPSQANIRFVRAIEALGKTRTNAAAIAKEALRLPDRSALFRQSIYGDLWPIPGKHPELTGKETGAASRPRTLPGTSHLAAMRPVPLPIYAPPASEPEIMAEPIGEEDELGQLEALLFHDLDTEGIDLAVQTNSFSGEEPPPPAPRLPIMERFDPSLGHKEEASPARDFLSWLRQRPVRPSETEPSVSRTPAEEAPLPASSDVKPVEKADAVKPGKEDRKKRKKKKEARKLAKSSIRPSQEVASETLAALLARQGHIDQALDMYQRLMLLVPEKKSIFAGQIAKLKRKEP